MSAGNELKRVLLVEDDLDVATGLGEYLTRHGIEVDFATHAQEAMHVARSARFDALVLDLELPGEDGIGLCTRLKRELGVEAPVLFLTARHGLEAKLRAFEAGAVDYVVKPFEPAELLARLRASHRRPVPRADVGLRAGAFRLDAERMLLYRDERHVALTPLTTRLVACLMQAHPGVVRRERLLESLWDGAPPESDPLREHVHQLRRMFVASFGSPLVVTVRGAGFRFDPDAA